MRRGSRSSKPPAISGSDAIDAEFFAKQNKKLAEENEKLRRRLDDQQGELDRLEKWKVKADAEAERKGQEDKFFNSKSMRNSAFKRPQSAAKQPAASSSLDRIGESGSPRAAVDARKVLDEIKKPLDDTAHLINEFASARQVPSVLAMAQAEAMRTAVVELEHTASQCAARVEALRARHADPRSLSRAQRARFEAQLADLQHEQRRLTEGLAGLSERFTARRDDVLQRTSGELVKAIDAYENAYTGLTVSKGELEALARLPKLCAPYSPEG